MSDVGIIKQLLEFLKLLKIHCYVKEYIKRRKYNKFRNSWVKIFEKYVSDDTLGSDKPSIQCTYRLALFLIEGIQPEFTDDDVQSLEKLGILKPNRLLSERSNDFSYDDLTSYFNDFAKERVATRLFNGILQECKEQHPFEVFFKQHNNDISSIQFKFAHLFILTPMASGINEDEYNLNERLWLEKKWVLKPNSKEFTCEFKNFSSQTKSRILLKSVIDDCKKQCYSIYKNLFFEMKENSNPSSYSKLLHISLYIIKKIDPVFLNYQDILFFVQKGLLCKRAFDVEGNYITSLHFTQAYLDYCALEETKFFLLEQCECYVADTFPKLSEIERMCICFIYKVLRGQHEIIYKIAVYDNNHYCISMMLKHNSTIIFNDLGIVVLKRLINLGFVEYLRFHYKIVDLRQILIPELPSIVVDYITKPENYDQCLKYWYEPNAYIELSKKFLSPRFLSQCGIEKGYYQGCKAFCDRYERETQNVTLQNSENKENV